jgi:hypothetical protein
MKEMAFENDGGTPPLLAGEDACATISGSLGSVGAHWLIGFARNHFGFQLLSRTGRLAR